jgi:ribonuclease H2 subunit B
MRAADAALAAANETTTGKRGKKASATSKTEAPSEDSKGKKRKASQGVERLKKANTDGMKKISAFFTAKK